MLVVRSSRMFSRVLSQQRAASSRRYSTYKKVYDDLFGATETSEFSRVTGLEDSEFSQARNPSAAFKRNAVEGALLDQQMREKTEGSMLRRVLFNRARANDLSDVDFKNPAQLGRALNMFARDGPREYVEPTSLIKPRPVTVTVTGAAGQIAYSLLFRIANGEMLGPNQPVKLRLLERPEAMKALQGVVMELQDAASPLVVDIVATADAKEAFTDCDHALLVGAKPRGPGMERQDLLMENAKVFVEQGTALNKYANKDVLVCVVGNPANTNALIAASAAGDIPRKNFSALTRLDHDRGLGLLAQRLGCLPSDIERFVVWGNHSSTMFPDVNHAIVKGAWLPRVLGEKGMQWIRDEFTPRVAKRGAEIIAARGKSSALSAADATIKHMRDWVLGNPDWTSMAVYSQGVYNLPVGYFISVPVVCQGKGEYGIVDGLPITFDAAVAINKSCDEIVAEKLMVESLLPNPVERFVVVNKKDVFSPSYYITDPLRVESLNEMLDAELESLGVKKPAAAAAAAAQ